MVPYVMPVSKLGLDATRPTKTKREELSREPTDQDLAYSELLRGFEVQFSGWVSLDDIGGNLEPGPQVASKSMGFPHTFLWVSLGFLHFETSFVSW